MAKSCISSKQKKLSLLPRFLFGIFVTLSVLPVFADGIIVKTFEQSPDIVCKKVCGKTSKCELWAFTETSNTIYCPSKGTAWVDNNGNDYETGKSVTKFTHVDEKTQRPSNLQPKELSDEQADEIASDLENEATKMGSGKPNKIAQKAAARQAEATKTRDQCKKFCGDGNCRIDNNILSCPSGATFDLKTEKKVESTTPVAKTPAAPKQNKQQPEQKKETARAKPDVKPAAQKQEPQKEEAVYDKKASFMDSVSKLTKKCDDAKNWLEQKVFEGKATCKYAGHNAFNCNVTKEGEFKGDNAIIFEKITDECSDDSATKEQEELKSKLESDVQQIINAYKERKAVLENQKQ